MNSFYGLVIFIIATAIAVNAEINFFAAILIVIFIGAIPAMLGGYFRGKRLAEESKANKALIEMNEREKQNSQSR